VSKAHTIDFSFSPEAQAYRDRVRAFLAEAMEPAVAHRHPDPSELTFLGVDFEVAMVAEAGRLGILGVSHEPELGGGGEPPSFVAGFEFEAAYHDAPLIDTALYLAGPPLVLFGGEQHRELARRMVNGELMACLAYTEPNAGSDLTGMTTTARQVDGGWIIDGEKVLVTAPWKSQYCVLMARTTHGVPIQHGASIFVVAMDTPGISVRRRRTMNGWTLGEITFRDVRVDAGALVGRRDAGWQQMLASAEAERGGMFYTGWAVLAFDLLVRYCLETERDGVLLADDPMVRDQVAALKADVDAVVRLNTRVVWEKEQQRSRLVTASMTKVFSTELLQRLAQVSTEVAGHPGLVWAPLFGTDPPPFAAAGGRFAWDYLERVHPAVSVGGNELQRDLVARMGLGLPRRRR
jgi:alkylation response protein AidB-like acyl-CoA dehydrogenase